MLKEIILLVIILTASIWVIYDTRQERIETESLINNRFNDQSAEIETLRNDLKNVRYMLADSWMYSLDNLSKEKISNFKGIDCEKTEIGVSIMRNWYSFESLPFNNLVVTFKKGYMVYFRNGDIKCYPEKIEKMNPENISCDLLCED